MKVENDLIFQYLEIIMFLTLIISVHNTTNIANMLNTLFIVQIRKKPYRSMAESRLNVCK